MKKLIAIFYLLLVSLVASELRAQEPLKVVTTLSTFADLVRTIGGERVQVTSIAPPTFNPHFIEARPSDVLKVKRAELFVHAGLDLEVWRAPLVDAVARTEIRSGGERQLDLSQGIALLEIPDRPLSRSEGDIHLFGNPHYWLDPRNGEIMARNIAQKLIEIDPSSAAIYERNLNIFVAALKEKILQWQGKLLPLKSTELIGYHNEWIYLMNFAGVEMKYFLEPKPGIPPSPKQVEFLVEYIKSKKVAAIIQATYFPLEAGQEIAKRTGSKLLLLCQNVGERPEASSYIDMLDYNLSLIVGAYNHE